MGSEDYGGDTERRGTEWREYLMVGFLATATFVGFITCVAAHMILVGPNTVVTTANGIQQAHYIGQFYFAVGFLVTFAGMAGMIRFISPKGGKYGI